MVIYAANIHQGGGRVLLEALLVSIKKQCTVFVDARLILSQPVGENVHIIMVHPSVFSRLKAEFNLRLLVKRGERVLSFGNLPPLFSSRGVVDLFFQNTIFLKKYSSIPFPAPVKVKHLIERMWLKWGLRHVSTVYVQSESVREGFLQDFPNARVQIAPFMAPQKELETRGARSPAFDFIYVASGDPHKNHRRLLQAWQRLAKDELRPSLALTLSENYKELLSLVETLQGQGLKITNYGNLTHPQTLDLIARSRALIFPSLTESFGLPLLEAQALGLSIIASELEYVREFVSPVETFDPSSEKSIFLAVKRFLRPHLTEGHQKIYSPEEFLQILES